MPILPPVLLLFCHVPGCSACEATTPHVDRFEQRNPGVRVQRINMLTEHWPFAWNPPGYPTFLLIRRSMPGYRAVIGMHTTEQLEYWVRVKSLEGGRHAAA